MAKTTSKKTSAKKAVSTRKPAVKKTVSVDYHVPGNDPTVLKLATGTTLGDFISNKALGEYTVSVNGSPKTNSYTFADGDLVRIGLKTKNA